MYLPVFHPAFRYPIYCHPLSTRYALCIHKSDITALLQHLCRQGLLLSDGYGRGTKYILASRSAKHKVTTNDANVDSSNNNVDSLDANVDSLTNDYRPSHNAQILLKKKRLSQADMESLINEIAKEWRTIQEFTTILGKDKSYLRNHVLPPLISKGTLEREYPSIPNHPNQRYRVKQS